MRLPRSRRPEHRSRRLPTPTAGCNTCPSDTATALPKPTSSARSALRGDSYALAETVNGLYKSELIHHRRQWRTVDDVEPATPDLGSLVEHQTRNDSAKADNGPLD